MNIVYWRKTSYHIYGVFIYNKTLNRKTRKKNISRILKEFNDKTDIKYNMDRIFLKRAGRVPITEKNIHKMFYRYVRSMNKLER